MPVPLSPIAPIKVDLDPPPEWEQVGRTPRGLPIFRIPQALRTRNDPLTDANGRQVFGKHPTTGEELYSKRKLTWWYEEEFRTPNQQGNGNLTWDRYFFPTPEEVAAAERDASIAAMMPELAGTLVDEGLTPASFVELIRRLRQTPEVAPQTPGDEIIPPPAPLAPPADAPTDPQPPVGEGAPPAGEDPEPPVVREFPRHIAFGEWELSDGSKTPRSTKREEAEALEAALTGADVPPE